MPLIETEHDVRMFTQSLDQGMVVEVCTNGKPVRARDFAALLVNTVQCLEGCDEKKECQWAITEANIIGDLFSFTLVGLAKAAFKTKTRRPKKEMNQDT
jgi:hypothetical protein